MLLFCFAKAPTNTTNVNRSFPYLDMHTFTFCPANEE
jgi:hypothetical protein